MAEPVNIVLTLLRELRAEIDRLDDQRRTLETRFESIRMAVNGESFMGRVTAGEMEEQIAAIRERLDALEAQRS